jgi:hypothetical protein
MRWAFWCCSFLFADVAFAALSGTVVIGVDVVMVLIADGVVFRAVLAALEGGSRLVGCFRGFAAVVFEGE